MIQSYTKKREKETEIIDSREDDTLDMSILEMLRPLPNKNISGDIKELEDFFDIQESIYNKNNVVIRVCQ